jgi:GT2 family glycosyltransferase/acetyltransferase-like isoleucine patch superfamily enzyme
MTSVSTTYDLQRSGEADLLVIDEPLVLVERSPVPEISIVIVHFGPLVPLRRALRSIYSQREVDLEVLVADNSPDGVASGLCDEYPTLEVISLPHNPGFGVATNRLVESARAPLLLILNPDTEFIGERDLRVFIDRYEEQGSECGIYSPLLRRDDGSIDHACSRNLPTVRNVFAHFGPGVLPQPDPYVISDLPRGGLFEVGAVNGAFMLTRSELYEQVGGFDERFWMYGEDLDMCKRVASLGKKIVLDLEHSAIHSKAGTTGPTRTPRVAWAFYRSMVVYFQKHASGVERLAVPPLSALSVVLWIVAVAKYLRSPKEMCVRALHRAVGRVRPQTDESAMRETDPTDLLRYAMGKGLAPVLKGLTYRHRFASAGNRLMISPGSKIYFPNHLSVGDNFYLGRSSWLHCFGVDGVRIGDNVTIRERCWLQLTSRVTNPGQGLVIEDNVYIGPDAVLGVGAPVRVGFGTQIGAQLSLAAENHVVQEDGTATGGDVERCGIDIGSNVWVGNRVSILDGVSIGDGSIVGAGAVVTKSFGPNSVIVGVPGRNVA